MRLWSLHPEYLDSRGLVALWREALLAQAVLRGRTRGYRSHPQLARFAAHPAPRLAINAYLHAVHDEALARGYDFDKRKAGQRRQVEPLPLTRGQLQYEWRHLMGKLSRRDRPRYLAIRRDLRPQPHPLFRLRTGGVAPWERMSSVEAYLRDLPPASARIVRRVRAIVRKAVPESGEKISYGIPAFTLDRTFMYCAAFKAHVSIFPPLRGDPLLAKRLTPYANEKGNLRFPLGEAMPWPLITRLVKALAKQAQTKRPRR